MTLTLIMIHTDFQSDRSIDGGTAKAGPPLLLRFCQIKNRRLDLARHVFCNGGLFTEAMAIRKAYAKYTARTARITMEETLIAGISFLLPFIFFQQASQQNQWFNQVCQLVFHQHERRLHIFQPVKFMCNELFGMNTAGLNKTGQVSGPAYTYAAPSSQYARSSHNVISSNTCPSLWYYQYSPFAT